MERKFIFTKLLLVLLLGTAVLTACTITNNPTPEAPLAEVVTVSGERPSATPLPSSTPIVTRSLVETAVPTSTPSPTTTPTATAMATPFLAISAPILSSQGQLAFIKNQTLFVETAPKSGEFTNVAQFVNGGVWSPDGLNLAFFINDTPNRLENGNVSIWESASNSVKGLGNIVSNFPTTVSQENNRGLNLENITWSPDNTKISFTVWEQLEPNLGGVWIADFTRANFNLEINGYSTYQSWWLDEQTILVDWHCGSPCEGLTAYKNGELLWELPWQTGGQFVLSSNSEFLINTGRTTRREPFATVDQIDLATGEVKISWQAEESGYFPLFPPNLSPDNNFVSFHFGGGDPWLDPGNLYIIDLNGRSYGQRPNSAIMDWRPGGGPVVKETVTEEQTQLIYWPLDGSVVQVVVNPLSLGFGEGAWSGDGRFFIYSAVDEAENKSHLYLWHPESGEPTLLYTTEGTDGFRNFTWLPDSTAVYFNFGRLELWKFEAETESLSLIASSVGE